VENAPVYSRKCWNFTINSYLGYYKSALPVKGVVPPYDVMSIAIETSRVVFIAAATSIIVGEIQRKSKVEL
jgi:hypothetical protein